MADRYAVATGNWSDPATWDGGTLPDVGDDVYADGFTVTIDISPTVASVRTTQRTGGTIAGDFVLADGVTLTANVVAGMATTQAAAVSLLSGSAAIVGNVTGGVSNGVSTSSDGTLVITGTVTGGAANGAMNFSNSGTLRIVGDVIGGSGVGANGVSAWSSTGTKIEVIGNAIGGSGNSALGAYANQGYLLIAGDAIGGSGVAASGTRSIETQAITVITGYAVGNDFGAPGGSANRVSGVVQTVGNVTVGGIKYGPGGMSPTSGVVLFNNPSTLGAIGYSAPNVPVVLADYPAPADVRLGTEFAFGESEGTLVAEYLEMPSYLVDRLSNAATVESTGAQIAALCSTP